MSIFTSKYFDGHEQVVCFSHKASGLTAVTAIHSTALGPAVGGCRMWNFASEQEAIDDALRLSRGMSYKCALVGLPLGGGKTVIIGDSKKHKSPALFRAFGRCIETMGGHYITGEDIGTSVQDMAIISKQTKYVVGLAEGEKATGDPSPFTAHGVFCGIEAAVKHRLGKASFEGLRIIVQGLGHVGYYLAKELHEAGANLVVADINQDNVNRVVQEFGAHAVHVDDILQQEGDVLAPCAMGGILNDKTIPHLGVPVVAGAANNQLEQGTDGQDLAARGILYAPDYVINAGGLINCAFELVGKNIIPEADPKFRKFSKYASLKEVEKIAGSLKKIFESSKASGLSTSQVADALAVNLIKAKIASPESELR